MLRAVTGQPIGLLIARALTKVIGSLSTRERYGVLHRPQYAYGLLRAASMATYLGRKQTTVCEFGVARGAGLINMIELAEIIGTKTGVRYRIVGFDTGSGLPCLKGHKDHPELWRSEDFAMGDHAALKEQLAGKAELIMGDLKNTIPGFVATLSQNAPIGFLAVDVDIYSATRSALRCLLEVPDLYAPVVSIYFDDVAFYSANRWCGELAAIEEFNADNNLRKIDVDRSLPGNRPIRDAQWYRHMYTCHILDHKDRRANSSREPMTLDEHQRMLGSFNLS